MGRLSFESYGGLAKCSGDYTVISGRYKSQKEAEKKILQDVIKKLDLNSGDSVLEIGCGVGNLLIPLAFFVKEITGVDHSSCLGRLRKRFCGSENVKLVPGNFLDTSLDRVFDKVVCYSVLHYLADKVEVFNVIHKALQLLTPGGKALFGDIPNQSAKKRFVHSEKGREFHRRWQKLVSHNGAGRRRENSLSADKNVVHFDDDLVLSIVKRFRREGYHVYILAQPPELPFGNTREDILITKPG